MLVFLAILDTPDTKEYLNMVYPYNKGFNRTLEGSAAAKPGEPGGGAG